MPKFRIVETQEYILEATTEEEAENAFLEMTELERHRCCCGVKERWLFEEK